MDMDNSTWMVTVFMPPVKVHDSLPITEYPELNDIAMSVK